MNQTTVVMPCPIQLEIESALQERFNLLCLWKHPDQAEFNSRSSDIRALVVNPITQVRKELLDSMPSVEIVSTFSVGLDHIDLHECKRRGIAVTYTPDVVTDDTADTAMSLILATLRRICAADRYVRQGFWEEKGVFPLAGNKVTGKRLGIVGLGRIGTAIARRAEGFSCSISYYSRKAKAVSYTWYESLVELARDSDILVVACAMTEETFHLINREVIDALGSKGTLINIARGPIVDEEEMVSALVEGRLGAAGLDVFEKEPKVPEVLFDMENVVLLPHVGTATSETRIEMANLVVRNLEAHFAGKPLVTPV